MGIFARMVTDTRFSAKELMLVLLGCALAFVAGVAVIFGFDGTGDDGDSITHYLYARYAPAHPELYFDHWAKPLYVLLASPFAQFGFAGIKFFNLFLASVTLFLTYRCAAELNLRPAWLAPLLLACFPLNMALTFSGLTEPLFACLLMTGLLLLLRERRIEACIVLSFLPFVRSEGLIILGVTAVYLVARKNYMPDGFRMLPWLLAGTVAYSLAGLPVYGDPLWVFTNIPYATTGSVYGSGRLFHFVEQLFYVVGVPAYILFCIGVLTMMVDLAGRRLNVSSAILVLGGFGAFFIAHTLFWHLGIFNSMGLKRVLIAVLPLAALICLYGAQRTLLLFVNRRYRNILLLCITLYVVVFPYTSNPAALNASRDLRLSGELKLADKAAALVKSNQGTLYYDHQYFSLKLDRDHFDEKERRALTRENVAAMKSGEFAIWDNSPSRNASELDEGTLRSMGLREIAVFDSHDEHRPVRFVVFGR